MAERNIPFTQAQLDWISEYTENVVAAAIETTALHFGFQGNMRELINSISLQMAKAIYSVLEGEGEALTKNGQQLVAALHGGSKERSGE